MPDVYAFKNIDKEVMKSSSGGAFIAICQTFEVLHGIGNVAFCGAAFDDQMMVKHMCVESAAECCIFQGAKYVKSECNYIFPELKNQVLNGRWVMFSGTPCQVYALKSFLHKEKVDFEMVFTIDVVCHGVPKKEFWLDYKNWIGSKAGAKLKSYSFRYKLEGWKAYPAYSEFENGKRMVNTPETSVYSRMHMARYSISKGCFSCPFSKEERVSDITLGDYWGVEKIIPDIPSKTGVSLVLVHTNKGKNIVKIIEQTGIYLVETEDRSYLKHQHNLNRPTERPERYDEFWKDYENDEFEGILRKYLGYGLKYKIIFVVKKMVRKTPLIEWYRSRKSG